MVASAGRSGGQSALAKSDYIEREERRLNVKYFLMFGVVAGLSAAYISGWLSVIWQVWVRYFDEHKEYDDGLTPHYFYLWLVYRTFPLRAPLWLSWRQVYRQLGADPAKGVLILYPSPPSILPAQQLSLVGEPYVQRQGRRAHCAPPSENVGQNGKSEE